jgi:hypothetical protein
MDRGSRSVRVVWVAGMLKNLPGVVAIPLRGAPRVALGLVHLEDHSNPLVGDLVALARRA